MTVIMYRSDRLDCIAAAWIVSCSQPGNCEFIPVPRIDSMYSWLLDKYTAYIIGNCYTPTELAKVQATAKALTVITAPEQDTLNVVGIWATYNRGARPPWLLEYLHDIISETFGLLNSEQVATYIWGCVHKPADLDDAQIAGAEAVLHKGEGCAELTAAIAAAHEPLWYWANFADLGHIPCLNTASLLAADAAAKLFATQSSEHVAITWHTDGSTVHCRIYERDGELPPEELTQYFDGNNVTGYYVAKDSETFRMLLSC